MPVLWIRLRTTLFRDDRRTIIGQSEVVGEYEVQTDEGDREGLSKLINEHFGDFLADMSKYREQEARKIAWQKKPLVHQDYDMPDGKGEEVTNVEVQELDQRGDGPEAPRDLGSGEKGLLADLCRAGCEYPGRTLPRG